MLNNRELTDVARGIARNMTYNDDTPQAEAKHMLRELAHRLDSSTVNVHRKSDGLLIINGLGKARFMTKWERVGYALFGARPRP